MPSFLQSLALGSGHAQTIDVYKPSWPFPSTLSHRELVSPPAGMRAWKDDVECLWAEHGVWKWDEGKKQPVVLKAGYFSRDPRTGKAFDFYSDAYFPFVRRFAERMHKSNSDWLIPVGPIPNEVRSLSIMSVPMLSVARQVLPTMAGNRSTSQPCLWATLYVFDPSQRVKAGADASFQSTICIACSPNHTET